MPVRLGQLGGRLPTSTEASLLRSQSVSGPKHEAKEIVQATDLLSELLAQDVRRNETGQPDVRVCCTTEDNGMGIAFGIEGER